MKQYNLLINIMCALQGVIKSNLGLLDIEKDLYELFDLYIKIHTCVNSGYRCMKRIDAEGNKVCRTPPYPVSKLSLENANSGTLSGVSAQNHGANRNYISGL